MLILMLMPILMAVAIVIVIVTFVHEDWYTMISYDAPLTEQYICSS